MALKNVKELREEFSKLHTEATGVIDAAANENRELKDEEKTANETKFTRMKTIKALVDDDAKFAALALGDAPPPAEITVEKQKDAPGRAEFDASEGRGVTPEDVDPLKLSDADKPKYSKELTHFARTGEMGPMARKFATITTSTGSGILLPKAIAAPITPAAANAFRRAHDLNGVKPLETGNTAKLTIPVLDASSGGVVAENASTDTENPPSTTESIQLTPQTFESGSAWFSNLQLAAVDFDLLQSVLPQLTFAKELGLESAIAAALIADASITQVVTPATLTGFTYANLVDLNRALPSRYDMQKAIVLGRDAFAAAEKLVGSDGHPVLIMDPQNQGLYRFNGTFVLRSDFMEAFGASKCIGAVFSLMGFRIRDVTQQNLARYVNVPTRPNQTGLNLFAYHAYGWAPSAVAKFKTAAS